MKINYIDIRNYKDKRGQLSIIQNNEFINFKIKRVYYIYKLNKKYTRGSHAHYKTTQIAVCIKGSCKYKLDNGHEIKIATLSDNNKGLVLEKKVWHELMEFSNDCILLILANSLYDRKDYIERYEDFIKLIKRKKNFT